jgi:flagellar biosynthesis anti-sigma factor FlgM
MNVSSFTGNTLPQINTQDLASPAQIKVDTSLSTQAETGASATTLVQEDKMHLSSAAAILSPSSLALNSDSDSSSPRVSELQASIAAGTYNVSASALADKLFSSLVR